MGHVYGLAMPFVKRAIPIQPVQLENVSLPGYLKDFRLLLMTYEGMKPLSPDVHAAVAQWVRDGGTLAFVDADSDPFLKVREWWNTGAMHFATPREHLFLLLGVGEEPSEGMHQVGRGRLIYLKKSPTALSLDPKGGNWLIDQIRRGSASFPWRASSSFVLERGPYVVASGMDETTGPPRVLHGDFVDLFDPSLSVIHDVTLGTDSRHFLVDLSKFRGTVVASAGKVVPEASADHGWSGTVEGIAQTNGVLLLRVPRAPKSATIDGQPLSVSRYDPANHLVWLKFSNTGSPRAIPVSF